MSNPVPPSEKTISISAAVAALLLFAPLFIPLLTGRVFAVDDLSTFHLPLRYLYSSSLANGHSVVWTPMLFGGFYVHAEGQVGMFHPAHWLLYRTLPLAIAFNIELIASYLFAFAGMWLLLRRLGLSTASRTIGAMAFTFSGFNLLHLCHMNAVAIAAHMPWLLFACDCVIEDTGRRQRTAIAGVALLVGSQVLLGYPQYVWMSVLACGLWALVRTRRFSRLAAIGGGSVLGLVIGGVQLLPTLDLLRHSARAVVSSDFPLTLSLHPLNLLQLWSPFLFPFRVYAAPREMFVHELGLYTGALATIALVWAFLYWRELAFRQTARAALVLCGAGLLLALGRYGFVYEALTFLPVVGKFRAPARHILLLHLGLSLLVAITFHHISRRAPEKLVSSGPRQWIWLPFFLSLVTGAAALAFPSVFVSAPSHRVEPGFVVLGTVLVGIVTFLVVDALKGSAAIVALPLVLALDLGFWGYSYNWGSPPATVEELKGSFNQPPPTAKVVHSMARDRRINLLLLHDLKVFRPYVGLPPARTLPWDDAETARLAGVDWLKAESWSQVRNPSPRVRILVDGTESVADVHVVRDDPGRLEVDIATQRPAQLVTTESYHAGWRAERDRQVLTTFHYRGDFLGVNLEPGQYRVVLTFAPKSLRHGLILSLAGLTLTALIAAIPPRRRR